MPTSAKSPKSLGFLAALTAVALFVAALIGLLGVLYLQEQEERRTAVVRDVHWVEQNLRFDVAKDLDQLGRLGADWDGVPAAVGERCAALIQGSAGLVGVAIQDEAGRVRASVPSRLVTGGRWPRVESRAAREAALASGSAAWGAPYGDGQDRRVDVFVPWYREGRPAGTVAGTYGLRVLLAGTVPWWLAERHRVAIVDAEGATLAAKTSVEGRAPELTHEVPLDPPGHGLRLRLDSYGSETRLLRNVLLGAIALLALAVYWTLWVLRGHVRRRLATEEALRAEHAFRKAMEDSLHTGLRAVDLEGRLVYVNPAFCSMVGWSEAELLGASRPRPYWPPDERDAIERALQEAREHGMPATGIELRLVRRSGERFDALLYEAPLIDAEGRQTGWMGSVLDTTERKRARERLRQQEEKLAASARLVTMGEMASTIAHELNQPLSAIASYTTGCLNLLEAGGVPSSGIAEALRKAREQALRAGRIIRRVHDFVRKREPTRVRVAVNAVVEEAIGFLEAEARKRRVRVEERLSGSDPEIQGDPLLLQQVVLNLLRNAMDAMAATPDERREIRISTDARDGWVTVAIADRGCGIAPEVREQLFEPFFTTRAEGMGMGLNICRSIMELHGGRVWAEENPGGGTVFSFSVPMEAS